MTEVGLGLSSLSFSDSLLRRLGRTMLPTDATARLPTRTREDERPIARGLVSWPPPWLLDSDELLSNERLRGRAFVAAIEKLRRKPSNLAFTGEGAGDVGAVTLLGTESGGMSTSANPPAFRFDRGRHSRVRRELRGDGSRTLPAMMMADGRAKQPWACTEVSGQRAVLRRAEIIDVSKSPIRN